MVGHDSVNKAILLQMLNQSPSAYWKLVQDPCALNGKRPSGAVQSAGLKFQGISASMSLFGHRLAIRSRVCLAQALGSTPFILQV